MTLVNVGARVVTVADVDASIARVIDHAESIWDEWAWQVENETWTLKGFADWDEMRREVYGGLTAITAPRKERPELIARFRRAGLTQHETAATLGVSRPTVARHDEPTYEPRGANVSNDTFAPESEVIEAELIEDAPPAPDVWRVTAADWGEPVERSGVTDWSRSVQDISARLPIEDLADDELAELLGAVEFLHNYIKGETTLRQKGMN